MSQEQLTESSPLLGKTSDIVRDAGDAQNGVPASNAKSSNGHTDRAPDPSQDEESQGSDSRVLQYEGMPEVKKKLKYILPAIGIGVSLEKVFIL